MPSTLAVLRDMRVAFARREDSAVPGARGVMLGIMRVLVLGGTAWLGHAITAAHLAAGHDVTCLARGTAVPPGAALVQADRDDGVAAFTALGGDWDEVVDVTRIPAHAAAAAGALAERASHWTLISTVSVYASNDEPGADESASLLEPLDDPTEYGRAKVAIEQAMQAVLDDRLLILRPGLIVGPGDPSDRHGSWLQRAALAGAGPLLVPERDVAAQIIDVRDLAVAAAELGGRGVVGIRNAVGRTTTLHALIEGAREAAGHTGPLVAANDAELERLDVQPWAGPRALTLWLPEGYEGHGTRSNAAFLADGARLRPAVETARDVLADERRRGLTRARANGIGRTDELAVLAALGHAPGVDALLPETTDHS